TPPYPRRGLSDYRGRGRGSGRLPTNRKFDRKNSELCDLLYSAPRLAMCRLLFVKSNQEFALADQLQRLAFIAKNSREFQGHGWGCAYRENGVWQHYKNIQP